jgi:hypothetical protein
MILIEKEDKQISRQATIDFTYQVLYNNSIIIKGGSSMLFILIALLFLIIIIRNTTLGEHLGLDDEYEFGGPSFITLATSMIIIIGILFIGGFYLKNIQHVAELEAFYNDVKSCYEYTVDETLSIDLDNSNFAYFGLASVASERIKELRDEVKTYNYKLARLRKYKDFFVTSNAIPHIPEYLIPISLK